jgi:hypothetical protein
MLVNAKPGAGSAGNREIIISDWKPLTKNTLRGFFSASLPSGMILRSVMLHEKGEARWIGLPAREWTNDRGEKQFSKLIEFSNREVADKFRDTMLEALDRYLAGLGGER